MNELQRVVIIDDHPLLRKGLMQLAEFSPDLQIVGESDNGQDGVKMVQELHPDLVILDLNMPGMNGLETLIALKQEHPDICVVILTVSDADADVLAVVRAGADGYLLKDMDPEELLEKFREVASGHMVMSPHISDHLARGLRDEMQQQLQSDTEALTKREQEILIHIRDGESNKVIGRNLDICEATVKVHVKHLLRKLKLKSRVEAAVWATKNGDQLDCL